MALQFRANRAVATGAKLSSFHRDLPNQRHNAGLKPTARGRAASGGHQRERQQQHNALLGRAQGVALVALLSLASLTVLHSKGAAAWASKLCERLADAAAGREEAFIGYSERAAECKDRLEDCHGKAKRNGCIRDPYNMRTFCPISCGVSKCMSTGTLKEDTSAFAQRWTAGQLGKQGASAGAHSHFRNIMLGGDKLQLSSVGVGTYLGALDARTDEAVAAAVVYSVASGWNVIDTASNYRWGRAEAAVGAALDSLLAGASVRDFLQDGAYAADVTRGMLFISTKAGFVDEALVRQLVKDKALSRKEVVSGHSLAPAYLRASVEASLERLNLHTAFKALEELRAAGSVRHYGVASWDCFRVPPTDAGHLSLEEVVSWAREAGGEKHGLAAIQLPVSASMPEAWSQPWQLVGNNSVTVMKAAEELGLAVFTSGPLGEGDLLKRLTGRLDGVVELRGQTTTAQKLIQPSSKHTSFTSAYSLTPQDNSEIFTLSFNQNASSSSFNMTGDYPIDCRYIARSTPGKAMATALVGHKTREFVVSNTALAAVDPMPESDFHSAMKAVRAIMSEGGAAADDVGADAGGSGAASST
eukprot:XP_001692253.1 predicted protein [Chlamydomonas reinhardtii]